MSVVNLDTIVHREAQRGRKRVWAKQQGRRGGKGVGRSTGARGRTKGGESGLGEGEEQERGKEG